MKLKDFMEEEEGTEPKCTLFERCLAQNPTDVFLSINIIEYNNKYKDKVISIYNIKDFIIKHKDYPDIEGVRVKPDGRLFVPYPPKNWERYCRHENKIEVEEVIVDTDEVVGKYEECANCGKKWGL
jgi:hypothetical protein